LACIPPLFTIILLQAVHIFFHLILHYPATSQCGKLLYFSSYSLQKEDWLQRPVSDWTKSERTY